MIRPPFPALFALSLAFGAFGPGLSVALRAQSLPEAAAAPAPKAPRPLAWAETAADRGDWDRAVQIAQRDGPVAVALITWRKLRTGEGTPEEVLAFLAAHPDWPGLDLLRKRSEAGFAGATSDQIAAFFKGQAPTSGFGALIWSEILEERGQKDQARAVVQQAWRSLVMSEGEQAALREAWPDATAEVDAERLSMLFWAGARDQIADLLPLVTPPLRDLGLARELARAGSDEAPGAIAALPKAQRDDPAIAYGLFRALMDQGQIPAARALLLNQSQSAAGLGNPQAWAGQRRYWARTDFQDGDYADAYAMASDSGLSGGADFADLEWLAGFIALRNMKQPASALSHFEQLRDGVGSPISLGRAWYWIGRAQEALGNDAAARAAYGEGAQYQTTYYGLLAAGRAGLPFDASLAGADPLPDWHVPRIEGSDLLQAALLLEGAGRTGTSDMFLMQMAEGLDEDGLKRLAGFLEARGDAHLLIRLGKGAADRGIILPQAYYALHPLRDMTLPVAPELALSIARRESEFNATAASPVGARGLMQLMPGTADKVARDLGIDHDTAMLTADWRHNATLGAAYLAELGLRFDGNVMMVAAAYNAGPDRVDDWIATYGDPRQPGVDPVDWAEEIPYRETRNYVQRVAESLPVYRARLGRDPLPEPFRQELGGSGLLPLSEEGK
ncbi:transglycosylase SLT domain-containing protein [Pseudooceanicola sp. CBS1P-1]|uniref:Transglycosylase SLT domain-containing protein n=1 Tax=Pseudooceanicola albus TaxID=2692189 RepID=A0A6L7G8C9_9RHOB|nr:MULTISPECIES: transglycosylase SLT domain-containing protein [Pseudooceanicola]MBT9384073.1 transglycosylase SLT domain-containing protein [Pseudooceanicola endophyticus]MXN19827.1 transglycosylase SLT domain-containing protein [Pseudooceanicola albus]